jgi:hypothetical protein
MTTVAERTAIPAATTTTTVTTADVLLSALDDAIDLVARHEDDDFPTGTRAGRLLADLAGLARTTVTALGADGGRPLAEGPGVVVVRELVTATRLLRRALEASGPGTVPAGAAAAAKAVHALLPAAVTAPR